MIGRLGDYVYVKGPGFQAVGTPCQTTTFFLFLPDEGSTLGQLVEQFTPENWQAWKQSAKGTLVRFEFPKFRVERRSSLEPLLREFGMATAFQDAHSPDAFRGVMTDPRGAYLTQVIQTAYVDVNEYRIDAGSVSYSGGVAAGIPVPAPVPVVIANRPFAFAIIDTDTRAILYLGAVVDP